MLAFVTGGTGFVGSNLVVALTNRGIGAVGVARFTPGPRLPTDGKQMRLSSAAIYADGSKAREELGVSCTPFRTAVQSARDWHLDNHYLREQTTTP